MDCAPHSHTHVDKHTYTQREENPSSDARPSIESCQRQAKFDAHTHPAATSMPGAVGPAAAILQHATLRHSAMGQQHWSLAYGEIQWIRVLVSM